MAIEREEWNLIREMILSLIPGRTMSFERVVKRDEKKLLVWTKEHGNTAIPLVDFERGFKYYDTQPTGNVTSGQPVNTKLVKKEDLTNKNPNLLTKIVTPKVGEQVIIIEPWGNLRFPVCLGVILSKGQWVGED